MRMIEYQLKVEFEWNKKIYRIINICGNNSLNDLSDIILESFNFDKDHLYLFNMDNKKYSENNYSFLADSKEKSTGVAIDSLNLSEKQKFLYLYDFGDEWTFIITIQKISVVNEHHKAVIKETYGHLNQYAAYESDITIRIDSNLSVFDIVNDFDDEIIMNGYSVLSGDVETKLKYNSNTCRFLAEIVMSSPERVVFSLPSKQVDYLRALLNMDNFLTEEDLCDVMKLSSFGLCFVEKVDFGTEIILPGQVVDIYKEYLKKKEVSKIIKMLSELETCSRFLLSKYGIVEVDELYRLILTITSCKLSMQEYILFVFTRLHYFGSFSLIKIRERDYLTFFNEYDALEVLTKREEHEEYRDLSYLALSKESCHKCSKKNFYFEYDAYKEWWEYLNFHGKLSNEAISQLLGITTYAAILQKSEESQVIEECTNIFQGCGARVTKKTIALIQALGNNMPLAVLKGRTLKKYELRENIIDAEDGSLGEDIYSNKKGNKNSKMKIENGSDNYEQLTLF